MQFFLCNDGIHSCYFNKREKKMGYLLKKHIKIQFDWSSEVNKIKGKYESKKSTH